MSSLMRICHYRVLLLPLAAFQALIEYLPVLSRIRDLAPCPLQMLGSRRPSHRIGNLSKIIEQHLPEMQNHQVESSHRTEKVTINEIPGSQTPHLVGLLELSPTVRKKKKKNHLLKKSSFWGSSVTPFIEQVT